MPDWMTPGVVFAIVFWIGGAALIGYMAWERKQNIPMFILLSIVLSPLAAGTIVAIKGYRCDHSFSSDNPNRCTICDRTLEAELTDTLRPVFLGAAIIFAISIVSLLVFGIYYPATQGQVYVPRALLGVFICTPIFFYVVARIRREKGWHAVLMGLPVAFVAILAIKVIV